MPASLQGILWMMVSCALLAGTAVFGRYISLEGVPTFQIVFLRIIFAIVAFTPLIIWRGPEIFRTKHVRLYASRVVIGLVGMTLWFGALAYITVGEVTAIGFLAPVIGTVGAAVILKEPFGLRRGLAIAAALVGALIIIRPGTAVFSPYAILPLLAAIMFAAYALTTRFVGRDEDAWTSLLYTAAVGGVILSLIVPFFWVPPDATAVGMMVVIGVIGAVVAYHLFSANKIRHRI